MLGTETAGGFDFDLVDAVGDGIVVGVAVAKSPMIRLGLSFDPD